MEINSAIAAFNALAQAHRLAIFRYLVRVGPAGAAVAEIRAAVDLAHATLSFHLATLKNAGLLQCRRDGRQLFYRVDYEQMRCLLRYLSEDCCAGRPEICAGLFADKCG